MSQQNIQAAPNRDELIEALKVAWLYMPTPTQRNKENYGNELPEVHKECKKVNRTLKRLGLNPKTLYGQIVEQEKSAG